jgi:FkbM family methyltransferase
VDSLTRFRGEVRSFGPGVISIYGARLAGKPTAKFKIRGVGTVQVRLGDSDLWSFHQVFVHQQYQIVPQAHRARVHSWYSGLLAQGRIPLIVDAGANVGAAALWFARSFPEARVVSLEPEPMSASICRSNVAAFPAITVLEAALGGSSGTVDIELGNRSWATRTVRKQGGAGVPVYSIEGIHSIIGPGHALFLAKIDIEGFEADLFANNTEWIDEVAAVFVEPHDWLFPGQGTSRTMQAAMFDKGFEILIRRDNFLFIRDSEWAPQDRMQ